MPLTFIWLLLKYVLNFFLIVLFKRNKIIDVFCIFPVCIKNQIIRINNQKREIISAFTLKHFSFPPHI